MSKKKNRHLGPATLPRLNFPKNDTLLWGFKYTDLEGFCFEPKKGSGITYKGKSREHYDKKEKRFAWKFKNQKTHQNVIKKLKSFESMSCENDKFQMERTKLDRRVEKLWEHF